MNGESGSGKKTTAEAAVLKMRSCRDENNCKMFTPDEYLTKEQMARQFSRLTREKKKRKVIEPTQIEVVDETDVPEEEIDVLQDTMDAIKSHFEIKISDFVCIAITNENPKAPTRKEHFIGQVIDVDDDMIEVSYLVFKAGGYYV